MCGMDEFELISEVFSQQCLDRMWNTLRSTADTFLGSKAEGASTSLGTRYHNRVQDTWMYKSPDPYDFMTFSVTNKEIRFYYYYFHFRLFANVFDILQEPVDMKYFSNVHLLWEHGKNFPTGMENSTLIAYYKCKKEAIRVALHCDDRAVHTSAQPTRY